MSEETHIKEHAEEHAGHHITPPKFYVYNALAVAALMGLTVLFGKWDVLDFHEVNGLNLLIALVIAIAKCGCIIAIFMGVWWNTPLVKMFALAVVGWLCILFMFTLIDVASPDWGLGTPYLDLGHPGQNPLHMESPAPIEAPAPPVHSE